MGIVTIDEQRYTRKGAETPLLLGFFVCFPEKQVKSLLVLKSCGDSLKGIIRDCLLLVLHKSVYGVTI